MKMGNVKRLATTRHFFLTWMCLCSTTVVIRASRKKTWYIPVNMPTIDPQASVSSLWVARKPCESAPMMR